MFGKSKDPEQDKIEEARTEYKQYQREHKEYQQDLAAAEDRALFTRTNEYKPLWRKNGIVQFKNERIAILKRQMGAQVEFIVAFDDLTKEGYVLRAIDEGKSADVGGGINAGASSYYYFQKMGT